MDFNQFMSLLKEELIYGSIAGLGICIVGHPFDTLKTRKQVFGGSYFKMISQMIIKEGPFSFYKGLLSPMSTMPLINSIVFSSYSISIAYIKKWEMTKDFSIDKQIMIGGSFAGFLSSFVTSPVELLKIKLQLQKDGIPVYKGNMDVASKVYQVSGFKGIFQGLYLNLLRDPISYMAQFYVYFVMNQYFTKKNESTGIE